MIRAVGIVGRARSGKDTAATILRHMNGRVVRRALADALKEDILALGLADKEQLQRKDPRTRRVLQVWGTEHGRCIDDDYWFLRWSHWVMAEQARRPFEAVVIPDIRFPNEANACLNVFQGYLLYIDADERLQTPRVQDHASESHFEEIVQAHKGHPRFAYVRNNDSLKVFESRCLKAFGYWGF